MVVGQLFLLSGVGWQPLKSSLKAAALYASMEHNVAPLASQTPAMLLKSLLGGVEVSVSTQYPTGSTPSSLSAATAVIPAGHVVGTSMGAAVVGAWVAGASVVGAWVVGASVVGAWVVGA
jgi:hypothetical protein